MIHLVLSGSLPLTHGSALGSAPFVVSGGGVIWGPPCSGVTHATVLHCVASTQSKPHPSLPLQKYEIRVEEVERHWADRVLERLNNAGEKQIKQTIHGELSGTLPLEREQTLFAASPP
jgi:hypothetical protein